MHASNSASARRRRRAFGRPPSSRRRRHDRRQLSLVDPARTPVEVRVAELALLERVSSLCSSTSRSIARSHARSSASASLGRGRRRPLPWRTSPSRITRSTIFSTAAGRARRPVVARPSDRIASAIAACVHLAALPCAPCGGGATGADVGQKLCGRRRRRGLRERAADVDSGVVVGATNRGSAVRLDVHERRQVQLLGARAVAGLPDREQLCQATPVARGQRRLDGVERVGERGGDAASRSGTRRRPRRHRCGPGATRGRRA